MIQFRDVTKDFKGNVVLSDISMEIKDKELTVLIGPSGCGKTTTLKMINRLIQPSKGNIFIDGKNIEEMDKVQLRRNMGYVIQQGGLFPHMTIRQNIEIIERLEKKDPQAIVDNTVRLMKMVDLNPEAFLDRYRAVRRTAPENRCHPGAGQRSGYRPPGRTVFSLGPCDQEQSAG